jgi:hypothetical protein
MDELLSRVLDAHGGLDRWSAVRTLTARVSIGGTLWRFTGWPDIFINETAELDPHRAHIVFRPFGEHEDFVFDGDPPRATIHGANGEVVEERDNPEESFTGFGPGRPWDAVQVGYFASYGMWNYLTTPFVFASPGVQAREIEPWQENGQTWRRLAVTFPESIPTHNADQVFYYDADFMQRRMDYAPKVMMGMPIVHYSDEPRTFDGLVFPTRREVHQRNPDGTPDMTRTAITIDIHSVTAE